MGSRDYSGGQFFNINIVTCSVIVFMEIVVYAANGLLKRRSENPLLIEIEEGHSNS